jgi:transposase
MMYNENIETVNMSNLPIIYQLCRMAKIMEMVNAMVSWRDDNSKITPGFLIETMVICILSSRKATWKIHEYWTQQDLDFFYPELNLLVSQLNDDAYVRALDKLAEVKVEELISKICLTMLKLHDINIETLHLDTTSKSVQGAYEEEATGDFDINHGYSKDHRPDLKQFKLGAAVQQNGLPVMGQLLSGNASDKEWNPDAVLKMKTFFENNGYKDVMFIGDSATVSSYESLKDLKGIKFISRLPETFSIAEELKTLAFKDGDFKEIGKISESKNSSEYKIKSYIKGLDGISYRFIVVHSSALESKKTITKERNIVKEKSRLTKKSETLSKKAFACEEDANRALSEFTESIKKSGFEYAIEIKEVSETVYNKKGRPKKDEIGTNISNFHVDCLIKDYDQNEYENLLKKDSTFILITSVLDETQYTDIEILEEYKHQNSIEEAFRFLKNPVYMGPVYLKNKERVESLGYVFILVLLIASYLEYRVRKSLKDKNEYVLDPGNKKNYRPSIKRIFEILEGVIITITLNHSKN